MTHSTSPRPVASTEEAVGRIELYNLFGLQAPHLALDDDADVGGVDVNVDE